MRPSLHPDRNLALRSGPAGTPQAPPTLILEVSVGPGF